MNRCLKYLGFFLPLVAMLSALPVNQVTLDLQPTSAATRSSEGAFVTLKDGGIAFYYTQFYGGVDDHSAARIAAITSGDGGRTWSAPREIIQGVDGRGLNVMSVSVLRLPSGRLALFYLFTKDREDCRPYMCVSEDEGRTWSTPRVLIHEPCYLILNNDRVILTSKKRLIMPMNSHRMAGTRGMAVWYYSDDEGTTWRESLSRWGTAEGKSGFQESGVVETQDGSLYSWTRTDLGAQYEFRSHDDGVTWSPPARTELVSPLSPASIKRLPGSGSLLALYNDHSGQFPLKNVKGTALAARLSGRRTPLVAAISNDNGFTWPLRKLVEDDPERWYHYVAIHFTADAILLAYNNGDEKVGVLSPLTLRRIEYAWLPSGR